MSTHRVVCAAIRAADGDVLIGLRHYSADMHEQIRQRLDGGKFAHRHGDDQGFVDQFGNYMTREQAYRLALQNGQILRPEACRRDELFSEGLY